jgi:F-type H+-transporting ATPase subunit delta
MSSREPASYARAVYESLQAALKAEGKEEILSAVMDELVAIARHGGPTTAEVTSAVALTEEQRTRILGELRGRYGQSLDIEFTVDPTVLGGLIVRVGDKVLDTTVRQRLNAVQRNMIAG